MTAVFLATALPCAAAPGASTRHITGDAEPAYPITRRLQFTLTVQNPSNRLVEGATLHAYAPVRQTATQKCLELETSHPSELTVDELGNQVLRFAFDPIPPFSTRIVTIRASLALSETPNPLEERSLERFLPPEPLIEADHPEILPLAETLRRPTPAETARSIFDWVAANIRYAGYLKDDRGALYALRTRQGDCTEYMSLFVALCRASGIPARGVAGYVYGENRVVAPADFHNWAEVHLGGAWQVADPQERVFRESVERFLAFRLLGAAHAVAGIRHRFGVTAGALAVTMQ
ncbi:MAG: transglutaminase-like domain-containing protein [Thermodesulfobacteriota bacterium]